MCNTVPEIDTKNLYIDQTDMEYTINRLAARGDTDIVNICASIEANQGTEMLYRILVWIAAADKYQRITGKSMPLTHMKPGIVGPVIDYLDMLERQHLKDYEQAILKHHNKAVDRKLQNSKLN